MPKAHVNGIDLYYEQEGKGHPLVLIPGYTADNSVWASVRQELAKHFSLTLVDNRGAGRSDCPDSAYTIETMAEDIKALIAFLKLDRPHLLGHSMGGVITQWLAYKYPHTIGKIILANSLIRMHTVPAFTLRYFFKMRSEGMPRITMREGVLPWLLSSHFLKDEKQVAELLKMGEEYPYFQTLVGQQRQLDAILQFDSTPWFKAITSSTLVIDGDEDILCPADSKLLAQGIRGAKHVTFFGQAHLPLIEKPDEFANAVIHFLA